MTYNVFGGTLNLAQRLHFIFNFNRNYASILYRFQVISSYLFKVADFNLPHLHLALLLGQSYSNFSSIFGIRKQETF